VLIQRVKVVLLADRTNGRAYATVLRPSVVVVVVCNVIVAFGAS